jgi:hypothetical protein
MVAGLGKQRLEIEQDLYNRVGQLHLIPPKDKTGFGELILSEKPVQLSSFWSIFSLFHLPFCTKSSLGADKN